eukprot:TRINITY_DN7512_c0_g2_i2.p1 TRINITY_DN7512_c0_g2~~TRINITY_DN7512_c0_g2_i2.p1  ORF type:complete len:290 (+),score=78.35 TRINITY_DN7512_c0_g2_i2:193-1062(+)
MIAKAITDERTIDLPLSEVFWKAVLNRPMTIYDVCKIDKELGETLLGLQEVVNERRRIEADSTMTHAEKTEALKGLKFRNASIEDLCLDFTLPGFPDIHLIENGPDMPVTVSNLDQYINLTVRYLLSETIKAQAFHFRRGFERVFTLSSLRLFSASEIEKLYCGAGLEKWDKQTLFENIVPAHGFTATSQTFLNLVEVMSEFNESERRQFLKFITGSPRLPLGGFKNLNPKLTAVKKIPQRSWEKPDMILPSVMTCQNYLKLPDYSSIELLRARVTYAMKEGQNSFSLS